ncbi:GNAT family N-acetyltransferase [Piscinibacter sp. XHJ-5]|uniref:GNAT family N-acetyltransferase n=1 Tax=Piscinibacter sp. XHJ-5 TaxID=3037797 RepID=UPI0024535E61|nr:GNAT family N-acetyltransferase [Piscinibacter sp. XHJ-5]
MTEVVFSTERLIVRRWRDCDLPALLAVYGDAETMRWVGDGRPITEEACVQWIEVTRANYEKRGYGMFAVEEKAAPGVIGFCGIVHPGGQAEPEIKYAFVRSHWGRGVATEAVVGLIDYAATSLGLQYIIATTAPANVASHRVLLKAGMEYGVLRDDGDESHTQLFHWHRQALGSTSTNRSP